MKIGIWVYYFLQNDFIAANLCENKSVPDSDCKGKCYLQKKLKEEDHKNKKASVDLLKEITLFIQGLLLFQTKEWAGFPSRNEFKYCIKPYLTFIKPILQPPQLCN